VGPELVLGPRVTIDEHPVPLLDILVDRPRAGVQFTFEPPLCQREGPSYFVDEATYPCPDDLADGSWATVRLLGRQGTYHALHGEAPYPLRASELEGGHPGALLRPTVVGQRQHRHEPVPAVFVILDVRPQLPYDGSVIPFHVAVRLRMIRRGVPVGDPKE